MFRLLKLARLGVTALDYFRDCRRLGFVYGQYIQPVLSFDRYVFLSPRNAGVAVPHRFHVLIHCGSNTARQALIKEDKPLSLDNRQSVRVRIKPMARLRLATE